MSARFQTQEEWRLERLGYLARLVAAESRDAGINSESRQLLPLLGEEIREHSEWLLELRTPEPPVNPVAAQAQKPQPQISPQPTPA